MCYPSQLLVWWNTLILLATSQTGPHCPHYVINDVFVANYAGKSQQLALSSSE